MEKNNPHYTRYSDTVERHFDAVLDGTPYNKQISEIEALAAMRHLVRNEKIVTEARILYEGEVQVTLERQRDGTVVVEKFKGEKFRKLYSSIDTFVREAWRRD